MPESGTASSAKSNLETLIREGMSLSGNEKNVVFLNLGKEPGKFANVSSFSGFDDPSDGRGLAMTDWDGDGDLDAWISNRTGPSIKVLENKLGGRSVSFELVGTKIGCNRDAIGAKVEISVSGQRLVRSLRAGDGFRSQSSKRLHFGLGEAGEIFSVLVRWPDGSREFFQNVGDVGVYRLIQGTGTAKLIKRTRGWSFKIAVPDIPENSEFIRTPSAPLFPKLVFEPFKATEEVANPVKTLVLLWQPECSSCIKKLRHIADCKEQLKEAGMRVIALTSARDKAKRVLIQKIIKKTAFPFKVGELSERTIREIETLHRHLFYQPYQLKVPMSFLLNDDNRLIGVNREEIDIPNFLKTLKNESAKAKKMRVNKELGRRSAALIKDYLEAGLPVAAEQIFRAEREHDTVVNQIPEILRTIGEAYLVLRHFNDARRLFEETERLQPNDARIQNSLGVALLGNKNIEAAMQAWRKAIELSNDYAEPKINLGKYLLKTGKTEVAIEILEDFQKLQPNALDGHQYLSIGYLRLAKYQKAILHLNVLIEKRPDIADNYLNLAKVYLKLGNYKQSRQILRQGAARKKMPVEQREKFRDLIEKIRNY